MTNTIKTKTAAVATAVGLSLGGAAYATAATSTTTPPTTSSSATPGHPDETPLTGTTADKVKAAALAKVPGATVLRVESDTGGVYEAHVRKSDGTEVEVHVDKDYNVTSVDTRPAGRGGHGGGGHGRLDAAALAKAVGVDEAKVTAAIAKVAPAKDHNKDDMAAALAKALDQPQADVQAVLDANRPDRSAGPRGGGDRTALAKALATKLGISQSTAQSALDAAHDGREDALAAALAKELGVDAAKVKAALDAQHPDHP